MAEIRPVYCGNYEYEMPERDIKRLFEEYGPVKRIDMKTGFCFIYMDREDDAEYAIRKLDGQTVGYKRRPLLVQWAKAKDVAANKKEIRPSSTLFVVNFDVSRTRSRDIERHFDVYGRIKRVEIKKSYAFVQFEKLEDAEYAFKKANGSLLDGRTITVEYVQNENPDAARERGFPDRDRDRDAGFRDRSPPRRSRSPPRRERSRSPPRRDRGSPVYNRDRSRSPAGRARSPVPARARSPLPARSRSPPRRYSRSPSR